MKKVLGMLFLLLMLLLVALSSTEKEEEAKEPQEIIETIEYLSYEDFLLLYSCKPDVRKTNDEIVELLQEDAVLLMKVARQEGGAGTIGQAWVMRTILNRLDAGWADNLWDLLNEESQFEVVTDGSYLKADVNAETHIALAMIESGWDETQGALYWEANTNTDNSWHKRNLTFIKEIEGNRFYK